MQALRVETGKTARTAKRVKKATRVIRAIRGTKETEAKKARKVKLEIKSSKRLSIAARMTIPKSATNLRTSKLFGTSTTR